MVLLTQPHSNLYHQAENSNWFLIGTAGAAGQNKQHSITKNTAKLDRETEELHHDRVPLEVGKVIQQGRQSKGLTQKDLATVGIPHLVETEQVKKLSIKWHCWQERKLTPERHSVHLVFWHAIEDVLQYWLKYTHLLIKQPTSPFYPLSSCLLTTNISHACVCSNLWDGALIATPRIARQGDLQHPSCRTSLAAIQISSWI